MPHLNVASVRRRCNLMGYALMEHGYWHNLIASFSTFLNVLRGGPREPICTTLHDNIEAGGWASRVPWPASWLAHFRFSAGK